MDQIEYGIHTDGRPEYSLASSFRFICIIDNIVWELLTILIGGLKVTAYTGGRRLPMTNKSGGWKVAVNLVRKDDAWHRHQAYEAGQVASDRRTTIN